MENGKLDKSGRDIYKIDAGLNEMNEDQFDWELK